jgi:hypothetical protein
MVFPLISEQTTFGFFRARTGGVGGRLLASELPSDHSRCREKKQRQPLVPDLPRAALSVA